MEVTFLTSICIQTPHLQTSPSLPCQTQAPTLSVRLPAFSFEVRLGEEAIRPLAQQFVVAVFELPRLWPASQA